MQILVAALFLALTAGAQNPETAIPTVPGCGPDGAKFAVSTEDRHPFVQPEAGKSVVYFLEDDRYFESMPRPTTRWGIDGTWVGATHANSYFYVTIEPGEHHLCTAWQSTAVVGQGHEAAALHFTAEPGGAYYFSATDSFRRDRGPAKVKLEPVDSDEARLLMGKFAFSTSHPKK